MKTQEEREEAVAYYVLQKEHQFTSKIKWLFTSQGISVSSVLLTALLCLVFSFC
jgi:hypothetical protein